MLRDGMKKMKNKTKNISLSEQFQSLREQL